jgi:hypothetical protein
MKEAFFADLDELHEEVDVLGVELLAEVGDGVVHVLRQRVLLTAPDEEALTPNPLHVLPRRRRRSGGHHRRRRSHCGQFHRTPKGKRLPVASSFLFPEAGTGDEWSFSLGHPGRVYIGMIKWELQKGTSTASNFGSQTLEPDYMDGLCVSELKSGAVYYDISPCWRGSP